MIEGISSTTAPTPATSGFGELDSDVFLQLLVAQLRYQNPMEPADTTSMLAQTSQFTMVETLQAIADTQRQLINMTQLSTALDMVGLEVQAIRPDGEIITAIVDGVRFDPAGVILDMGGEDVPMLNIVSVNALHQRPSVIHKSAEMEEVNVLPDPRRTSN